MVTYEGLPSNIKELANSTLGYGVLRSLMPKSKDYGLEIKIDNGVLTGFAVYSHKGEVGWINALVVNPVYHGSGYGQSLLLRCIKSLSLVEGVERIIAKVRRSPYEKTAPVENMLAGYGFRKYAIEEKPFAGEDSGYTCNNCNDTPDSCDLVHYQLPL